MTMIQGRTRSRLGALALACAVLALLGFGSACDRQERPGGTHTATGDVGDMLVPGTYTAGVKAIVCDGCGPLIERTLRNFEEIEAVAVDQKSKTVQFTVKKGGGIAVDDLQEALDEAAGRMGMGADYALSDLRRK
jgi:hypothetical protein